MPITKGAIRKQRADVRKQAVNLRIKRSVREAVAKMRKKPTAGNLVKVFSSVDRAAKKGVVAKNKAARWKSRLSRLVKRK